MPFEHSEAFQLSMSTMTNLSSTLQESAAVPISFALRVPAWTNR